MGYFFTGLFVIVWSYPGYVPTYPRVVVFCFSFCLAPGVGSELRSAPTQGWPLVTPQLGVPERPWSRGEAEWSPEDAAAEVSSAKAPVRNCLPLRAPRRSDVEFEEVLHQVAREKPPASARPSTERRRS